MRFIGLLCFWGFLVSLHLFKIPEFLCILRNKLIEPNNLPVFTTIKNFIVGCFKYFIYLVFPIFTHYSLPISGSMMPTYLVGDLIYSSKYSFAVHQFAPYSIRSVCKKYFPPIAIQQPKIGDCCIFFTQFSDLPFSKRIIALSGDEVYVNGHMLTINGVVCPLKFLRFETIMDNGIKNEFNIYERTLPNGFKYEVAIPHNIPINNIHRSHLIIVPEDHAFMMGDNLYNSADSVDYLGLIHINDIFSKLEFVIMRNDQGRSIFSWIYNALNIQFGVHPI